MTATLTRAADMDTAKKPGSAPPPAPAVPVAGLLVAAGMGLLFGLAFEKSRVFEPQSIRGQFLLRRWIMLKMFLAATAAGGFGIAAAAAHRPVAFDLIRSKWAIESRHFKSTGPFAGVTLGAVLLGVGMSVSGACPGMVLAQLGAGVNNSWITLLGGLAGALFYGIFETRIKGTHYAAAAAAPPRKATSDDPPGFVDQRLGVSFVPLCVALSCACALVTYGLEAAVPWEGELDVPNAPGCTILTCRAWPPWVGGALIGVLQVPAIYGMSTFLGSSSSYQTISCCWVHFCSDAFKAKMPHAAALSAPSLATLWQPTYVAFAVVGALGSAR